MEFIVPSREERQFFTNGSQPGMLEPAQATPLNRLSPSPGKGESSRFVNTYCMAAHKLRFLQGVDYLFQHRDRLLSQRTVAPAGTVDA
jgi:hypothetical protein